MSKILKLTGLQIRNVRKFRGLTQESLAEKSGLQHTYIGGVERGERNISLLTLEKILDALNISEIDLFRFAKISTDSENINKHELLEIHTSLLSERELEEIRTIHEITRSILQLTDKKDQ